MTPDYHAFVSSSYAAERAGDAQSALEYHQGIPMFGRSAHRVVLRQLADVADEMTPWLWARWAAYQTTRAEDPGTECGAISRGALDFTVHELYSDRLQRVYEEGGDPISVVVRTLGQDWMYHQLCTFELGGLQHFLDDLATGRLAAESALARQWTDARIGGYRVDPDPDRLIVHDLAEGRTIELLDLGARVHAHAESGGWLIGRVVPSGTTPALMFDTRPLPVDERTARECAENDAFAGWIDPLRLAVYDGRIDRGVLQIEDRELVTDVPGLALLVRATEPSALSWKLDRLAEGRDEIGRAAYRVLSAAAAGEWPEEDAAYVAAAVVHPHAFAEARQLLTGPRVEANWLRWAELVSEPAAGRLVRLAELSASSG